MTGTWAATIPPQTMMPLKNVQKPNLISCPSQPPPIPGSPWGGFHLQSTVHVQRGTTLALKYLSHLKVFRLLRTQFKSRFSCHLILVNFAVETSRCSGMV